MSDQNLKRKPKRNEETEGESGGRNRDKSSVGLNLPDPRNKSGTHYKESHKKKTIVPKIPSQVKDPQLTMSLDLKQLESITKQSDVQKKQIKAQEALITQLLKEKADFEKNMHQEEYLQNLLRLGHMNKGHWSDGYAFDDLNRRQEEIKAERAALKRKKNELIKTQKSISKNSTDASICIPLIGDSTMGNAGRGNKISKCAGESGNLDATFLKSGPAPGACTSQELHVNEEILELHHNYLKRLDAGVKLEKQSLERESVLQTQERFKAFYEDECSLLNDRYSMLKFLGRSGSAEMFEAFDLKEQRHILCKIHRPLSFWNDAKRASIIENAVTECNMQRDLDHPHVVKVYDGFKIDAYSFCSIMELCDGNNLELYLKLRTKIPEKGAKSLIMQVVSVLKYLNELQPPIIHFHMKPGNIMLTEPGEIKITDFSISKYFNPDDGFDIRNQNCGNMWYLPPECLSRDLIPQKVSSKVDVWSVGVIFYECLYGIKPFDNYLTSKDFTSDNELVFPNKPKVSIEAKNFIRDCLTYQQQDRMHVMEMAQHAYLQPPSSKSRKD